jgi:NTP-dependent ternary system trypsin peptidase co-occuring protein
VPFVVYQLEGKGSLLVETDDLPGGAAGPQPVSRLGDAVDLVGRSLDSSLDSISSFAAAVLAKLRSSVPDPPKEIELTFGLKALGEVQAFAVAKASGEANCTVRMKWHS